MARGFQYAPGASEEVALARQPVVHRTELAALGQSKNAVVREAVAARDDIPLGLMATLAHDRSAEVRATLAANPAASETILDHLAKDRHADVVVAVLSNPATAAGLVEKLAFHKKDAIRRAAAERLNSPPPSASNRISTPARVLPPELGDRTPATVDARTDAALPRAAGGEADVVRFPDGAALHHQPQTPAQEPARPTRTAPIRGFRIPDQ